MQPWYLRNKANKGKKGGRHWSSILDIEPKTNIFFFDSFGLDGWKHIEKVTRTDNKTTLFNIRFNLNASKNLFVEELDALSDTVSYFFHLIQAFGSNYVVL